MVEELEVCLVLSQDRVIPFLRSRSLTIQFLVSVVVLVEVFLVYTQDRVLQRFMEQIIVFLQRLLSIPAPRGAPRDFHQNPLPAAGSSDLLETANQGVFRTFPRREDSAYPGVGTGRGLQLMAS